MSDVGIIGDEGLRSRVDVIAALGDGQRDDAQLGTGQQRKHLGRLLRREQVVDLCADDAHAGLAVWRGDGERIQAVLCTELLGLLAPPLAAEQSDADDAPIRLVGQGETTVDVEGLVRAMEIAHAEMRDAAFEPTSVVGRRGHGGWQVRERAFAEFSHARLS